MQPAADTLTPRQHRFVVEYINRGASHGVGKEAAMAAGYSEAGASKTASELLKMPKVARMIERERDDSLDRVRIDNDWIINRLKGEATNDDNSGGERIRALELLGKVAGMFVERKEVTHNVNSTFFAELDLTPTVEAEWDDVREEPILIGGPEPALSLDTLTNESEGR